MRLKGIQTIEEANLFLEGYLKRHNERFSIEAQEKEDLHMPLGEDFDMDEVLCIKTRRALRNDFTVELSGQYRGMSQASPQNQGSLC